MGRPTRKKARARAANEKAAQHGALEVKYFDTGALIPYARNARTHDPAQVKQIAASIKEFGFTNPVLIDDKNGIIAGHGRVMAAELLGLKQVPTIELAHLTETQKRAYILADNRIALNSGWDAELLKLELGDIGKDFDLKILGFDDKELVSFVSGGTDGNTDPDAIPEKVETRCKPGDLWQLGAHRLLCGDSTKAEDVARLMGGEKADLWLTDPPYGVSYADKNEFLNSLGKPNSVTKRIENDHASLEDMEKFWTAAAENAFDACSSSAPYYWFACQGGDQMMMMMMSISRAKWKVRHELIWVKNNHVLGRCDYQYKHEPILYGWKKDGTHKFYGGFQTSVLEFPKPQSSKLHPTMKPIEILERLIENSSVSESFVLDTFLGSGSTLIACEKTGRRCFGMEIDPHYCDVILKRWEDFTGKKAKLIDG